jgi:PAS domain S-box-containing protein
MGPLQTNEAVFAHLIQNSPLAIVISGLTDGLILDVNDSYLQLTGYSRDEVIGQTSVGLGLWADPKLRAPLKALLESGQPVRDFEAAIRIKSGAERLVLATVSQIDFDGRACLVSQMHDITAQRHEQLQFRALVEQIPVITYVAAPDDLMTLTYISPQCEAILGYSPDEVLAGQPNFLTRRTRPEDTALICAAAEQALHTSSRVSVE